MAKMNRLHIGIAVVIGLMALATFIILQVRPNGIPDQLKSIPGFAGATKVSQNSFDLVFDVAIKDKTETLCRLNLKIDAQGNPILPQKDETFTVIITEPSIYNLSDLSGNRGSLPGVFITKIDSSETWSLTASGKDPVPVTIEPGKINYPDLSRNSAITGPKGLPITVESEGIEIASGRLPLSLNLVKPNAIATVGKAYVSHMLSSGLMHIYLGSQPVSKGSNVFRPAAQAVGSSIWFTEGNFVGFDGRTSFVEQNQKLYFKIGDKEQSVDTKGINPNLGAFENDGFVYWVDSQGFINKTSVANNSVKTNATTDKPILRSGQHVIAGSKVYDMSMTLANPMQNWRWTAQGWFLKIDDGYLTASGKSSWKRKTAIPKDAQLMLHSGTMAYFEINGKVSQLFDLENGQAENLEEISLQRIGEIGFPDGVYVKDSVQHSDGKSFWSRKGWKLEKFGAFGVLCHNPDTGEKELISHENGLKALFWSQSDCRVHYLDKNNLVFGIGNTVFSVRRIISSN